MAPTVPGAFYGTSALVLGTGRNYCCTEEIFRKLGTRKSSIFLFRILPYFPVIFYLQWYCFLLRLSLVLTLVVLGTGRFCTLSCSCGTVAHFTCYHPPLGLHGASTVVFAWCGLLQQDFESFNLISWVIILSLLIMLLTKPMACMSDWGPSS